MISAVINRVFKQVDICAVFGYYNTQDVVVEVQNEIKV